jgi:hypothetical protein
MFKQVGEAGTTRRIVFASNVVPDLNRHSRAAMVLDGKKCQPVGDTPAAQLSTAP